MKTFNVCFTMYCNENVKAKTQKQAELMIKEKYQDNCNDFDFCIGSEVDIDMSAELDKNGNIIS